MKVTKDIVKTFERLKSLQEQEEQLTQKLYSWMEKQGIDTSADEFVNGIGVRIGYNEFESSEHFLSELQKFIDGEEVGYG